MNRVQKGQSLRGNLTAEGWNAAMAAAEDLAGRLRNGPAPYRKKEVGG